MLGFDLEADIFSLVLGLAARGLGLGLNLGLLVRYVIFFNDCL